MRFRVIFSPEAQEQLAEIFRYVAMASSPVIAARYGDAIVSYCESLCTYPFRGSSRDDIRPGLRITHYKKRAVIAFDVDADLVSIIGVFYGGQDYESRLQGDSDEVDF